MRAILSAALAAWAVAGVAFAAEPPVFSYSDIDAFERARQAVAKGADPLVAYGGYVEGASDAFKFYAGRYGTTAESMARETARYPRLYARMAGLKPKLQAQEPAITRALEMLEAMAPPGAPRTRVFYIVGNQTAGGTPAEIRVDGQPAVGIAIGIDVVSMGPDVDMSEFPKGPGGRALFSEIPYVAVHEMAHVHQAAAQGGLANYRSIYQPATGSMLAIALREGCADYLTYLAGGYRREAQYAYMRAHEAELWAAFEPVMGAAPFSVPGWFSGTDPAHPDWPSQIGYALGAAVCQSYHESADDQRAALQDLFTAWRPADFEKIVAPYRAKMAAR